MCAGGRKRILKESIGRVVHTPVCMYNFRSLLGINFDYEPIPTSITHLKHNFFTFQPTLFCMTSYSCQRKVLSREVIITALTKVETRSDEITDKAMASKREIKSW